MRLPTSVVAIVAFLLNDVNFSYGTLVAHQRRAGPRSAHLHVLCIREMFNTVRSPRPLYVAGSRRPRTTPLVLTAPILIREVPKWLKPPCDHPPLRICVAS